MATLKLRSVALASVAALIASLTFVFGVANAESASAATEPSLTVTPIGKNKVRVTGKYPHKTNGKVTALYVMSCANPGKKRPSSDFCVVDWSGNASALTIAPKDADARTKAMYGKVLKTVGTVSKGVWSFSVDVTLPKSIKVNGKTIKCATTNKTCGIGTRLSASVSLTDKSADKFVFGSKKSATIKTTASGITAKKAGKATVKVTTTGVSKPTGKVTIKVNGKTVTKTLKSSAKGKATVTLPKLKKGKYTAKVTFTPSGTSKYATKKTTKSVKITVK